MKIEKISDVQIKFTLSKTDLDDREIKIEDLTKSTDKTTALFREIMEQAMDECGFYSDNSPLMVEAVPVPSDGIMIIVTKIQDKSGGNLENRFNIVKQAREYNRYKRKSVSQTDSSTDESDKNISIFQFKSMDDVIDLSRRLCPVFNGASSLHRMDGKYYLVIQNEFASDNISIEALDMMLGEYGEKQPSSILSKYYLIEHGEAIILKSAVKALARSFV